MCKNTHKNLNQQALVHLQLLQYTTQRKTVLVTFTSMLKIIITAHQTLCVVIHSC